jgi:hypothetical protein
MISHCVSGIRKEKESDMMKNVVEGRNKAFIVGGPDDIPVMMDTDFALDLARFIFKNMTEDQKNTAMLAFAHQLQNQCEEEAEEVASAA